MIGKTIKEAIIVEGRDDTAAIKRALQADTIETHGFGISKVTWELIEKAYKTRGIIIFTDPDYAGNEIRKKIKQRFPNAKEAFLDRDDAKKNGDIGIENATPENILSALNKAKCTVKDDIKEFTEEDLIIGQLAGGAGSAERRKQLGKILGIGYGNSKAFLTKLNKYGITREEYNEALRKINY